MTEKTYKQKYQQSYKGKQAYKDAVSRNRKRTKLKVKMLHSIRTDKEIEQYIDEHKAEVGL